MNNHIIIVQGGKGSGNWKHKGVKGQLGGSAPSEDGEADDNTTEEKDRVWKGEQAKGKNKLSKLEAGQKGEELVQRVFADELGVEFTTLNDGKNNSPIDLGGDHIAIEVKTGMATNGITAQHWRATIGQPGVSERNALKKMSSEKKRAWNIRKADLVMQRKQALLHTLSVKAKKNVKPLTVGVIMSPNGKKADMFLIPDFHLRLRWDEYATDEYYIGTYNV